MANDGDEANMIASGLQTVPTQQSPQKSSMVNDGDATEMLPISQLEEQSVQKDQTQKNEEPIQVKEMGFGEVLCLKLHTIPTAFGYWLLKNYNPQTDIQNIGSSQFKITPDLIHLVFGITNGKITVHEKFRPNSNDAVVSEWRTQLFGDVLFYNGRINEKQHCQPKIPHLSYNKNGCEEIELV
ncbi:hypothetical protein R6Q57_018219 [Mikania cordata]